MVLQKLRTAPFFFGAFFCFFMRLFAHLFIVNLRRCLHWFPLLTRLYTNNGILLSAFRRTQYLLFCIGPSCGCSLDLKSNDIVSIRISESV